MKSKYSERNGRVIDKEDSYSLEMKETRLLLKKVENEKMKKMKSVLKFITCGSVDDGKSTL